MNSSVTYTHETQGTANIALVGGGPASLVLAIALTRTLAKLLFGVSALDAVTFVAVAAAMALIAAAAIYLPARRATRIDPIIALRYE